MSVKSTEMLENASQLLKKAMELIKDDKNRSGIRFNPIMPSEISRLAKRAKKKVGMMEKEEKINEIMEIVDEKDSEYKARNSPERVIEVPKEDNINFTNYISPKRTLNYSSSVTNFAKTEMRKASKDQIGDNKSQFSETKFDRRRLFAGRSNDRISLVPDSVDFGTNIFISYLLHAIEIERLVYMNKEQIKEAEEMENEIDSLERDRNFLRVENISLKKELEELGDAKKNLEKINAMMRKEISDIKDNFISNKLNETESVVALKSEIRILMSKLQSAKNSANLFKDENQKLTEKFEELKKQADESARDAIFKEEYENLRMRFSKIEAELEKSLKNENAESKKNSFFQSEIKKIKLRNLRCQNEKLALEEKNSKLLHELLETKSKLKFIDDEPKEHHLVVEILKYENIFNSQFSNIKDKPLKNLRKQSMPIVSKHREPQNLPISFFPSSYVEKAKIKQKELKKEIKSTRKKFLLSSSGKKENIGDNNELLNPYPVCEESITQPENVLQRKISKNKKKKKSEITRREEEVRSSICERIIRMKKKALSHISEFSPSLKDSIENVDALRESQIAQDLSSINVQKHIVISGNLKKNDSYRAQNISQSIEFNEPVGFRGSYNPLLVKIASKNKKSLEKDSKKDSKVDPVQELIKFNAANYQRAGHSPREKAIKKSENASPDKSSKQHLRDPESNVDRSLVKPSKDNLRLNSDKMRQKIRASSQGGRSSKGMLKANSKKKKDQVIFLNKNSKVHRLSRSHYREKKQNFIQNSYKFSKGYSSKLITDSSHSPKTISDLRKIQRSQEPKLRLKSRANSKPRSRKKQGRTKPKVSRERGSNNISNDLYNSSNMFSFTNESDYMGTLNPSHYFANLNSGEKRHRKLSRSNYTKENPLGIRRMKFSDYSGLQNSQKFVKKPLDLRESIYKN